MKESLIYISSEAKQQILAAVQSPNLPTGYFLRIGMKGSACSASFIIGLDKQMESDEIHEIGDLKILIDRRHLMYLIGIKVGYEQTDEGIGFTIQKKDFNI